ncbi:MAG TPA: hypothetical protein VF428_12065 [Casimicrobiaceae bacterium]
MATAATRRRLRRIAAPAEDATSVLAELTFTVAVGDGAPAVVFDGGASVAPVDMKPGDMKAGDTKRGNTKSGGKPRRLTLLSY